MDGAGFHVLENCVRWPVFARVAYEPANFVDFVQSVEDGQRYLAKEDWCCNCILGDRECGLGHLFFVIYGKRALSRGWIMVGGTTFSHSDKRRAKERLRNSVNLIVFSCVGGVYLRTLVLPSIFLIESPLVG